MTDYSDQRGLMTSPKVWSDQRLPTRIYSAVEAVRQFSVKYPRPVRLHADTRTATIVINSPSPHDPPWQPPPVPRQRPAGPAGVWML
jgi:hypothetical protein